MSSLIVEICEIKEIKPHPNADRMEIAVVKGWECCVGKGSFKRGDKCIYFPVDCVLPESVSDAFGVTKYLSKGRIKAAKLRGVPSCGLVMPCNYETFSACIKPYNELKNVGKDVAEYFGCTKWEPPVKITSGKTMKENPLFRRYVDMENIKNFPDILLEGEDVIITEKIHGTNSRIGLIKGEWVAGSHNTQRKNPTSKERFHLRIKQFFRRVRKFVKSGKWIKSAQTSDNDLYWLPLRSDAMRSMIQKISDILKSDRVIVFGELYGKGVQDLTYNQSSTAYRVFDIMVNDKYLNYDEVVAYCQAFNIEMVPKLYKGAWSPSLIEQYCSGNSLVSSDPHMREGIVIKPTHEREYYKGRVIFKSISFEYLERKKGTENH